MEIEERPRLFFVEASGKELFDKVRYKYRDWEETIVPESAVEMKRLMPKISTGELSVRDSTIPRAGKGVFATRAFGKNEIITYYDGPVMSGKEAALLPIKSHHKSIVTSGGFVIAGHLLKNGKPVTDPLREMADSGVGAFLNDARDEEKNNVEFLILDMKHNQKIWVDSIKRARKADPTNNKSVRTLMPYFDKTIVTNPQVREKFKLIRRIIIVRALRDLNEGEELFVSYGDNYEFFGDEPAQRKRGPDGELREGDEKKQKCETCSKMTEYQDLVSLKYYCSPGCQSNKTSTFYTALVEEY